ncbi:MULTISPECIES: hypothetical protein [Acinetobacter]|uniref:hypothetical protein n=1 Tax=Acinetobacter TaxID=469 RepID=UPI0004D7179A|nr:MULTISPECIES: hypothetical protein [unclassified Acinetobacter]KEC86048.1 hypothetical protein DT74_06410 [Acinetobacter sp. ETR1]WEE37745.1 hypothetical protein PYV58_12375 [Acinetobacter sp. TAC-1]
MTLFRFLLFFIVFNTYTNAGGIDNKCFKNIDAYLMQRFGESFKEDENILVKNTKNSNLIFIKDKTANNSPEHFIIERKNGLYCEILDAPMSFTINFNEKNAKLPNIIITKSLGNPKKILEYKLGANGYYKLVKCKAEFNSKKIKEIKCDDIYN